MIELDGSHGEGGGQILRTSLSLALLTGQPFHLRHVRAGRSRPGLQPQHLMCVTAAAHIGHGHCRGASMHSTDLVFEPGPVAAGTYHFPIRTAGATSLVLHTLYLPLARQAEASAIRIEGGTHVNASPSFHFLHYTWGAYLAQLGLRVRLDMPRAGFYPRGGGELRANILPATTLAGFQGLTDEPIASALVVSAVGGLPEHIVRRQAERAAQGLKQLGLEVEVRQEELPGGPGTICGVLLPTAPAPTFFFALGERGKTAERVADEAVAQVETYLERRPGVDEHSADQLLLPLALAEGPSRFRVACISSHLLTNAAVIRKFLTRAIHIDGDEGQPGEVRIE
jgi:RNA 3'-terminal phosphate cyclase (ATP)